MVVAREDHATQIGLKVLQQGGNVVDAAVAVGFALAVTYPAAGNLGGGGFMLIRFADGRATFLDFRERAPEKASPGMYVDAVGRLTEDSVAGYRASGVPGTVRGLEYASRKYGRRPWPSLVEPAVDLAAKGFPVSYDLARSLRSEKLLARFAESRRVFQRDGRFYETGETLLQPELAATLQRIAREGARDFYEGETARRLAEDMARNGGLISPADLKNYTVVEREPLRGSYKGCDLLTAPPPSSGGVGLLQMLNMLDASGFEKSGAGSAASVHYMAEVMRRFFADRAYYLGDPDFVKVPAPQLTARSYAAARRRTIRLDRATPSSETGPGELAAGASESDHTTHYSIVDGDGNAVAVTYTINDFYGSGVTVPGLGFLLNDEMDDFTAKVGVPNAWGLSPGERNTIAPRRRPLSSMTPTIVTRGGKLYLVLGSPGGPTIVSTVLQLLVNVIDFGMDIQQAVSAPRFHHQWMPDQLNLESRGFPPDTIGLLRARGHQVFLGRLSRGVLRETWGDGNSIQVQEGWLLGAPDPRGEATARGY